jgi:hypothetical protein
METEYYLVEVVLPFLLALTLFGCAYGYWKWLSRQVEKELEEEARWFEKRLEKTGWRVEHGSRRLDSLDLPCRCLGRYPGRSQAHLLAVCETDGRTTWFFRLRIPVPYWFWVEKPPIADDMVVCVLQSSSLDFPRVMIEHKGYLRGIFSPRSSPHVRALCPGLCRRWVARTEDEGERTLTLHCDLEEVLTKRRAKHNARRLESWTPLLTVVQTVETSRGHLAIIGREVGGREELFQFIRQVRRILESIGQSDPFGGAFGSSRSSRKHA